MACNCNDNAWKICAYVDGELPAEEREALENSLRECADCRRQLDALRALDRLSTPSAPPAVSGQEWAGMLGHIRRQPRLVPSLPPQRPWEKLAPLGAVAALIAIAVFVANTLLRESPSATPQDSRGATASMPEQPVDGVRTIDSEKPHFEPEETRDGPDSALEDDQESGSLQD